MSDTFRQELSKFDLERVLPAWDVLLTKQQRALQDLGVPTMFNTASTVDREVCVGVFFNTTPTCNIHHLEATKSDTSSGGCRWRDTRSP
jgi:hypothetical protein